MPHYNGSPSPREKRILRGTRHTLEGSKLKAAPFEINLDEADWRDNPLLEPRGSGIDYVEVPLATPERIRRQCQMYSEVLKAWGRAK